MSNRGDNEPRASEKEAHVFEQRSDHGDSDNGSGSGLKSSDLRLRRLFSFVQLLGFSVNFMNSWEVIAIFIGASFWNGGPRGLAWGSLLVICGAMTQAMSMAELGSILPIAGAQ